MRGRLRSELLDACRATLQRNAAARAAQPKPEVSCRAGRRARGPQRTPKKDCATRSEGKFGLNRAVRQTSSSSNPAPRVDHSAPSAVNSFAMAGRRQRFIFTSQPGKVWRGRSDVTELVDFFEKEKTVQRRTRRQALRPLRDVQLARFLNESRQVSRNEEAARGSGLSCLWTDIPSVQ